MSRDHQYFGDLLADYANGCRLDLRAKLAADLLKQVMMAGLQGIMIEGGHTKFDLQKVSADCCDAAAHMVKECENRGWIEPMPTDDQLDLATKAHFRRQTRAQAVMGTFAQQAAQEEAPRVQAAVQTVMRKKDGH